MAQDYRTKKEINQTQALFTNGLFIGVLLGILLSIGVTLFITSGKSPFVFKDTEGACIEINSAFGDEDVIAIDEEASFDFYDNLPESQETYSKDITQNKDDRAIQYYLQVGAFSEESQADNLKAKLALMSYESVIMSARIGDDTFHRVSVGPYEDIDQAKKIRENLIKGGFKANLIKLTKPKD
ncbi:sporulation protein [Methylophilales bacterium MBRSG12]|uniref:Sporulation protein n=1 Tax=Methylophilales bacterium MBRS-H7 TaxID=1623450 RepID=A0A0H4IXX2_9PROT|nr:sporulation protein [Methylophilales bacterium MBRSF5]AKO65821.1 sporulation protein [Methylophilales bacterium MBRS-H7]AKO67141.1 sporulation protein [Methylophilales bacterium MBRSG12]